jgi:hypothetical protein
MISSKFLHKQAFFNGFLCLIGLALVVYLIFQFKSLTPDLRSGGTGTTIIVVIFACIAISLIYLFLALLMLFRFRGDLSSVNTKLIRRLHYENSSINLAIVFYKNGLWLINI